MAFSSMRTTLLALTTLTTLLPHTLAQTSTTCDPTKTSCKSDPALGTTFNTTYSSTSSLSSDYWSVDSASPTFLPDNSGMALTVSKRGDGPLVESTWYMFWGHVEVLMKAAPGQGIISSIVLLSDDLDEIDWEIMGGNTTHVETNYYGKGNQTQMNAIYYPCAGPQEGVHNYTINWNQEKVEWVLDGNVVRTLSYDDAKDGDKSIFPQTPMQLKIGSWAGGASDQPGTVTWAGGPTDFSKGPFSMVVKSVKATDGTSNSSIYSYGDMTGSYESIVVEKGISSAAKKINAPPPLTAHERWSKVPRGAQIAIICVVLGLSAFLILLFAFFCFKQRRAGKRERMQADLAWENEQAELAEFKRGLARSWSVGKGGSRGSAVRVSTMQML